MERVEAKIGNAKQPLFDGSDPDRVYYSAFGDTNNADVNILTYGEEIQYQKEFEVKEACIEALYYYIGAKVVVPGKYSIPFLARLKRRKRGALCNPIGKEHSNHILETSLYHL